MTQPAAHRASPPAASEVSALITWMRRLSDGGADRADPAQLAAFQHAKHDLLARIQHSDRAPADDQPGEPVD